MAFRLDHVGIVSSTPAENLDVARFFEHVLGCPLDGDPRDGYAAAKVGAAVIALHCGARTELGRHGGTLLQLTRTMSTEIWPRSGPAAA